MENLLYLLPLLACPAMMGLMMWAMRAKHSDQTSTSTANATDPERDQSLAETHARQPKD